MDKNIESLFNEQMDLFKKYVIKEKEFELGHDNFLKSSVIYSIFPTYDDSFYKMVAYDNIIGDGINTFLIRDFIVHYCGRIDPDKCFITRDIGETKLAHGHNKAYTGNIKSIFDFELEINGSMNGYIISHDNTIDLNLDFVDLVCEREGIDNVFFIYIDSQDKKYEIDCRDRDYKAHYYYITLKSLFSEIFKCDFFDEYQNSINDAVDKLVKKIGYFSMSKLTPMYLRKFKIETKERLDNEFKKGLIYQPINIDDLDNSLYVSKALLNAHVFNRMTTNKLHYCLLGTSEFAKAFITSEYLYQNYKENESKDYNKENSCVIDFTPIISGYAKSVELLLYRILGFYKNKGFYIARKTYKYSTEEKAKKCNLKNSKYKTIENDADVREITGFDDKQKFEILYCDNYVKYCNITLTPLFNFVLNNDILYLSEYAKGSDDYKNERKILSNCFENYEYECRNNPFHKGLIDEWKDVSKIRNNTLYILNLLLGNIILPFDDDEINQKLDNINDEYENVFDFLIGCRTPIKFKMVFNSKEAIDAIVMKDNNVNVEYDDYGFLMRNPIYFIKVDDKYMNKISFTRNNYPKEIFKKINGKYIKIYPKDNVK